MNFLLKIALSSLLLLWSLLALSLPTENSSSYNDNFEYQYFGKDANSTQNNTSLLVEAFDRDNTFSISAFKAKYPRSKWFFARGFDSVISAVNIRQDIPAGYNVYSIDYASFETPHVKNWEPNSVGPLLEIIDYIDDLYQAQKQQNPSATTGIQYTNLATFIQNVRNNPNAQMVNKLKLRFNIIACLDLLGVYARYEYDMADLVQREKSSFKYQIVQNENAGKAIPLTLLNDYNQYVNKYDTECAFFLGMEYLAMYAETLFEPIVIANAIGKIQKLTKTYKNFKTSRGSLDDMLKKNSSGVNNIGDDLVDAFKPGYSKESILAIPNGSRPNPSTYLYENYINSHLSKFEYDDIVRVTNQSSINAHGGTLGGTDAFVLPKSEFMEILAEHGKNLRVIETKLGFAPNSLGEDAVFAVIKRQNLGTFKIPTGNESGIINEFWMPGGKTSGGISEATVDLTILIPYEKL